MTVDIMKVKYPAKKNNANERIAQIPSVRHGLRILVALSLIMDATSYSQVDCAAKE